MKERPRKRIGGRAGSDVGWVTGVFVVADSVVRIHAAGAAPGAIPQRPV